MTSFQHTTTDSQFRAIKKKLLNPRLLFFLNVIPSENYKIGGDLLLQNEKKMRT